MAFCEQTFMFFCVLFAVLQTSTAADTVCTSGLTRSVSFKNASIAYISSTNFPNRYYSYYASCYAHVVPEQGNGIVAVFEQFYVDAQDELTIYTSGKNVSRRGGHFDPERSSNSFDPFVSSENELSISFRSIQPVSTVPHSGFRLIAKPYNLSLEIGEECGEERFIDDTYFVVSPNYPNDYGAGRECAWNFTSDENIRIVFFSFVSDADNGDAFIIDSVDSDGAENPPLPLNGDVTSDMSVRYYFGNSVQIKFQSYESNDTKTVRRFLFLIDSYSYPAPVLSEGCLGNGTHDMSVEAPVSIATQGYLSKAYANNLRCNFSFINVSPLKQVYMQINFETERCCDTMQLVGMGPQDAVLQGERDPSVYLANSAGAPVSLYYSSDTVRVATGFKGNVSTLDCDCQNYSVEVPPGGVDEYVLTSPGFGKQPTYCFSLNCAWSFVFAVNFTMDITANFASLRGQDVVQIIVGNETIASITSKSPAKTAQFLTSTSTGSVTVNFVSQIGSYYYENSAVAAGFNISMKPVPVIYTASEYIQLSASSFIKPFVRIAQPGETFLWTVQTRDERVATVFLYDSIYVPGVELNAFDGPDIRSPLITYSTLNFSSSAAPLIRSTGSFITFRLINANISSFHFSGVITDLIDATYETACPSSLTTKFNVSLSMELLKPAMPSTTCYAIFHALPPRTDFQSGVSLTLSSERFGTTKIYKGAIPAEDKLLASTPPYSFFVFDHDILISYTDSDQGNDGADYELDAEEALSSDEPGTPTTELPQQPIFSIDLKLRTLQTSSEEEPITNASVGYLFSPDYLAESDLGRITQRYSLALDDEDASGFAVEVVKPVDGFQISLAADRNGNSFFSKDILSGQPTLEICASNMDITYRSNGGAGKGMFVKYYKTFSDVCHDSSSKAARWPALSPAVILLTCLVFAYRLILLKI